MELLYQLYNVIFSHQDSQFQIRTSMDERQILSITLGTTPAKTVIFFSLNIHFSLCNSIFPDALSFIIFEFLVALFYENATIFNKLSSICTYWVLHWMKVNYEHQGSKFLVFILLYKLECELVRLPVFKKLSFWLLSTVSKSIYLHKLFTAFTIWAVSPSIKYFLSCLREKCFGQNKARKWSLQSCPWQCWSNDPVWVWNAPHIPCCTVVSCGIPRREWHL